MKTHELEIFMATIQCLCVMFVSRAVSTFRNRNVIVNVISLLGLGFYKREKI